MSSQHALAQQVPQVLPERAGQLAEELSAWLRGGGTQQSDGAYCGWRAPDGRLSYPYPEITGYILTFFAHETLDAPERQRADAAASWLADRIDAGDYACRPDHGDGGVFLFDIGMITHGLLSYGRRTGDQRLLASGRTAAQFLLGHLPADGHPSPLTSGQRPAGAEPTWSNSGSAHLLKLLQALVGADDAGVPGAAEAAGRLVDGVLAAPCPPAGAPVVTCPGSDLISLHAACYAAEGLWVWDTARRRPEARERAVRITEWVWQQQLAEGGFTTYAYRAGGPAADRMQSDVLAQAIRLARLLDLRPDGFDAAVSTLTSSLHTGDGEAAVLYWPQAAEPHRNCWASMFACQALRLCGGKAGLAWHELI
ncbi:hypothetical protein SSP35_04_02560 [Streptomyces sp. NBRC 110611]|uniref:hypothetical protein n=1 Tax=Streptomyces sp. NBRC 110611 TaxID=1621259 RepID=UPI0008328DBE|nr:hypothetical protein [Streptomyces sp. NBRC 110611]GAU67173.1 hypothetical protein SSP35_04_02560 [Streptomyces sp. NBRC 110611]